MGWPLYTSLSAIGILLSGAALLLWLEAGQSLFATRLLAAIAGCF